MSKNRMVNTRFWSDNFIVDKLNALDRLLFLYLLTNQHTNIIGIYEIPLRTAAFETGIEKDDLEKMLIRLSPKVEYFDGWVYIRRFTDHQMNNPKIQIGMERAIQDLPEKVVRKLTSLGVDSDRLRKAMDSLSIQYDIYKPEPELKSKDHIPAVKTIEHSKENTVREDNGNSEISRTDDMISKLFYEVIKSLRIPTGNHNTIRKKIKDMKGEDSEEALIKYLIFMRDQFESADFDYKPDINNALDVYTKRVQIKNRVIDAAKSQSQPIRFGSKK